MTIQVIPNDPIGGGGSGGGGGGGGGGGVTSVSGSAPVVSSGGTTPTISMAKATAAVNGYLAAADFSTFAGKQNALAAATALVDGYLKATDFVIFSNKQPVFNGLEDATKFAVTYSAANRQFSVTYTAGAAVTVGGVRYTKTGSETTTAHASSAGQWYCYYDITGALVVSSSFWDFLVTAPLAIAYYTPSNNGGAAGAILANEKHAGINGMDSATHLNLHTTRGTQLLSGVVASGYTLNVAGIANMSYAVSGGSVADEDLILSTTAQAQGGANTYRVAWKTGTSASPAWNWIDNAEGGIYSDGTNAYYNQLTGGSWQKTAISSNGFVNYWLVATTAASAPQLVVVMGQTTYSTLALAQAATFSGEVTDIGLFTAEGLVVYQMTYQRSAAYGAPGNVRLAAVTRILTSITSIPASSVVSGEIFPRRSTFSLPGPRIVQTDCTNWIICGRSGSFIKAWAVAKTGPTGAAAIFDVLKSTDNGATFNTIWSTTANRVQIAAGAVAGNSTAFDTTTFAAGDVLRIDIAQVGSTIAGADFTVVMDTLTLNS